MTNEEFSMQASHKWRDCIRVRFIFVRIFSQKSKLTGKTTKRENERVSAQKEIKVMRKSAPNGSNRKKWKRKRFGLCNCEHFHRIMYIPMQMWKSGVHASSHNYELYISENWRKKSVAHPYTKPKLNKKNKNLHWIHFCLCLIHFLVRFVFCFFPFHHLYTIIYMNLHVHCMAKIWKFCTIYKL